MERRLKERLTGAAVLVMLAVIFIPMILDNSGQVDPGITGTNIPPRPEMRLEPPVSPPMTPAPEPAPAAVAAGAPAPAAEAAPPRPAAGDLPAANEPAEPEADPPPAADETAAGAWIVQLGSFSSRDNALGLEQRLKQAGYPAYIEESRGETGRVYRVRIGPEIRKADAEETLARLGRQLDLQGIVLGHP